MDWVTKLEVYKQWHTLNEIKQQAVVTSYLVTHPGISTSDDWWLFLARLFGIGKLVSGYLDLEGVVH